MWNAWPGFIPLRISWALRSGSSPLTFCPLPSPKYYMSARHMALAKAFPEYFTYEPHEADAVSEPGISRGPGARGLDWEFGG